MKSLHEWCSSRVIDEYSRFNKLFCKCSLDLSEISQVSLPFTLALDDNIRGIDNATIDAYQGEENTVVILWMVRDDVSSQVAAEHAMVL